MDALEERTEELVEIENALSRAIINLDSGDTDLDEARQYACSRVPGLEQILAEHNNDLVVALYHVQLCLMFYDELFDSMLQWAQRARN
jgi:hypothetical protein